MLSKTDLAILEKIKNRMLLHAAAVETVQENRSWTLDLEMLRTNLSNSYDELNDMISRNSPKE